MKDPKEKAELSKKLRSLIEEIHEWRKKNTIVNSGRRSSRRYGELVSPQSSGVVSKAVPELCDSKSY